MSQGHTSRGGRSGARACGITLAACLAVSALGIAGCGPALSNLPREDGLHPRLTRYAYIEEGLLVSLAVDTAATRRREGVPFIPLGLGVANIGLRQLTLTRESLTLVDDEGNRYSMATVPEVRTLGGTVEYDRTLGRQFAGAFASRFGTWPQVPGGFYPVAFSEGATSAPGRAISRDRISLSRYSWVSDIVYFPAPAGKLVDRRYELWLEAPELDEPVFVKFRVK